MTPEAVEDYLTRLQKDLQRETVKESHDDDLYQQASMDVLRDCARYTVETDLDFIRLFCRYFLTIRKRQQINLYEQRRTQGYVYPLDDYCNNMGECQLYHHTEDPRTDSTVMTLEYIELLPKQYREIFVLLYVEGWTQTEVGDHVGLTQARVSQLMEEGIEIIRAELIKIG